MQGISMLVERAGDPAWQTSKVSMDVCPCAIVRRTDRGERTLKAIAKSTMTDRTFIALI